jgi:hypothetical protein
MNIEIMDLSNEQENNCLQDQKVYDQCIISQFLNYANNSVFSSLFQPIHDQPQVIAVPMDIVQEFFAIKSSSIAVSQCARSCSHFQVQFEQKANRYSNTTIFGKMFPFNFFTYRISKFCIVTNLVVTELFFLKVAAA